MLQSISVFWKPIKKYNFILLKKKLHEHKTVFWLIFISNDFPCIIISALKVELSFLTRSQSQARPRFGLGWAIIMCWRRGPSVSARSCCRCLTSLWQQCPCFCCSVLGRQRQEEGCGPAGRTGEGWLCEQLPPYSALHLQPAEECVQSDCWHSSAPPIHR